MSSLLGHPDLARDLAAVVIEQRVAEARAGALGRRTARDDRQEQGREAPGVRRSLLGRLAWRHARLGVERS